MTMPVIDAHHHFWRFNADEYAWIGESQTVLRRDFLPSDLAVELRAAGVDGVVSVQARQSLAETEWLLELAARHAFIRGVVGWVPLVAPDVADVLGQFTAASPKLRGVRHVLQDEADAFFARDDFNRGLARLREHRLVYDLLIHEGQLPAAIALVDRHPEQVFVLDHLAKPRIRERVTEPWAHHISELARRPNVTCKVSGMVTEADPADWSEAQLRRYFDIVLAAFGPERLMFGTDWPVCLLGTSYPRWHQLVAEWSTPLSADERAMLLGGTAQKIYG